MRKVGLASVVAILAACGSSSSGGSKAWRCDVAQIGLCIQLSGTVPAADVTSLQQQCSTIGSGAAYAAEACPTANVIGRCTIPSPTSTPGEVLVGYFYAPQTPATAEPLCTAAQPAGLGGTWSPM